MPDKDSSIIVTKYGYINFRNSPWKLDNWLVSLDRYDRNMNKISDELDRVIRTGRYTYVVPGHKILLDLGDKKVPIGDIPDRIITVTYSPSDEISINVVAADKKLRDAVNIFRGLGGKLREIYRDIYAFSGYIQLNKIEELAQYPQIGYIEIHHTNYFLQTAWTVLQMRIGTLQNKLVPPSLYPYYNMTPWGRGIFGDPNMAIAIVDTGIDDIHPLTNKVIFWKDYSGDGATSPEGYHGHGTHCASIATGNYWSGDYVEWSIIARNRTDNLGASGTYYLNLNSTGWYGVVGLYYYPSSGTANISMDVYSPSNSLLNTSRQIYYYSGSSYSVEIEQAVFNASTTGNYSVVVDNLGNQGGILIVTWEKQFPRGGYGSQPGRHMGVAPNVSLVGLKIFNRNGNFGDYNYDAIRWLIANASLYNITVSSNSWGGGDDATLNQLMDQLVSNGVVTVVAAGNDGYGGNIGSPGSADLVITVAAMNDINEISGYSTSGDATTGNTIKPDVSANGGTGYYNGYYIDPEDSDLSGSSGAVAAADSNDADNSPDGGGILGAATTTLNNFWDIQGTSMATPHVSGLAALVISAMGGVKNWSWDLEHSLFVKMVILMTAVEFTRNESGQVAPTPDRGGKDNVEGYGRVNGDAAVMAILNKLQVNQTYSYVLGTNDSSLEAQAMAPRVWAGNIHLIAGNKYRVTLDVPNNADFDVYIYSPKPDEYGQPIIVAKGASSVIGGKEDFEFTPDSTGDYYVVVKWIDRSRTNPSIPDYENWGRFNLTIRLVERGIPLVHIVSPQNGFYIPVEIFAKINATDVDGTISSVKLILSNATWSATRDITGFYNSTSGYYEYSWYVGNLSNGWYNLTANATDNDGKYNWDRVEIFVLNKVLILLVDDDTGANYEIYYESALESLGFEKNRDYLYWNLDSKGTPPLDILNRTIITIWYTGDDYSSTLTSKDQKALSWYLRRAGQLFISGQDIGFDIGSYSWYKKWLKANYLQDDSGYNNVAGISGTIFASAKYDLSGSDSANNNNWPDVISPNGSKLVMYYDPSTLGAAISYDDLYRLVYFAFPFEAINGSDYRTDAMNRTVSWMENPIGNIYWWKDSINGSNEFLYLDISARAFNGLSSITILINGSDRFSESTSAYVYLKNITLNITDIPLGQTINVTLRVVDSKGLVDTYTLIIHPSISTQIARPTNYDVVWGKTEILVNVTTIRTKPSLIKLRISNSSFAFITDIIANYNSSSGYYYYIWDTTTYTDGAYNITVNATASSLSSESNVINVGVWNGPIPILLVDADHGYSFEKYYMQALRDMGYRRNFEYVMWDINSKGEPPGFLINRSVILLWESGYSYPYPNEQTLIEKYLSFSGSMFISGQDIGYYLGDTTWYKTWLKAKYVRDDTNIDNVTGVSGTMFNSARYNLSGSDSANNNGWPDQISPSGSQLVMYYDSDVTDGAAVAYDGAYRLIYFAFPFEAINGSSYRKDAMKRIINWLGRPICSIQSPGNNSVGNLDNIDVSVVARGFYGLEDLYIYINGSLVIYDSLSTKMLNKSYILNVAGYPDFTVLNITLVVEDSNLDRASSYILYVRDKVSPSVSIGYPSNYSYFNTTKLTVRWSGNDNYALGYYEIALDNESWINVDNTEQYVFENLTEGKHTVYVRAYDKAGNSAISMITFIIDLASPTFVGISPTNNSYTGSETTFTWRFDDNYGINHYNVRLDNDTWITTTTNYYVFSGISDGNHTVYIVAYDHAGNTARVEVIFTVDGTPPEINITDPISGAYINSSSFVVSWNMSDNIGLSYCEVSVDGGSWVNVGLNTTFVVSGLVEESHTISVKVYDNAGNSEEDSITVVIDLTPPAIVSVSPAEQIFINRSWVLISWSATDNFGIDGYFISINNASAIALGSSNQYNVTELREGMNVVRIIVTDKAGNTGSKEIKIFVDLAPPSLSVYAPYNNSYINSDTVTLTWNMSDNWGIDRATISFDGGNWVDLGISYSYILYNLSEGYHTVIVRVFDKAGNHVDAKVTFSVDYSPPSIEITYPKSGEYINSSLVEIRWDASDNSGIDHYEVRIDGGSWVVTRTNNYNVSFIDGMHIVDVVAYDIAGNSKSYESVFYIDTSAPTVIIIYPNEGEYLNLVAFKVSWSASDNFGIYKCLIKIDNSSWMNTSDYNYVISELADGKHKVYVVAYDFAGNKGEASVEFIVDRTPPSIDIISPSNGTSFEEKVLTISWNVSDNIGLDHIEINIDNASWRNIGLSTSISLKLVAGNHTVVVKAIDKAGNLARSIIRFSVAAKKVPSPIMQWLALTLVIIVVGSAVGIYLYYYWKRKKVGSSVQEGVVEETVGSEVEEGEDEEFGEI